MLITASSFVSLIIAAGVVGLSTTPPKRGEDLCIRSSRPESVIAVIIDASGEFTPLQQQAMQDRFLRALGHLSPPEEDNRLVRSETRIDLYDARADAGQSLEPVFSRCAPAPLNGLSALVGNKGRVEQDYRQDFLEPLLEAFEDLIGRPEAQTSPILESVTAAVEHSFQGRTTADDQDILIISDLLQNSSLLSFYRSGTPDFSGFSSTPAFNAVRPDMKGAGVCPVMITRTSRAEDQLQTLALVRWWEEYALANRGRFDGWCTREFQV